jgi:hypothetical protein
MAAKNIGLASEAYEALMGTALALEVLEISGHIYIKASEFWLFRIRFDVL